MSHLIDIISLSSDSDDFYNSNINSDHSNISIETVSATYDGSSTIDKVNEGVKKTKNDLVIPDVEPIFYIIDKIPYVHTTVLEDMKILKKNFHIYVPSNVIKRIEKESKPKSFRRRNRNTRKRRINTIARVRYNIAKMNEYAKLKKEAITNNYYEEFKMCKPLTIDFIDIKHGISEDTNKNLINSVQEESYIIEKFETSNDCYAPRSSEQELPSIPHTTLKDRKRKNIHEPNALPTAENIVSVQEETQAVFHPLIKKVKNVEDINREYAEKLESVNVIIDNDTLNTTKVISTNNKNNHIDYEKATDTHMTFSKEEQEVLPKLMLHKSRDQIPESTAKPELISKIMQNLELQEVVRSILEKFQHVKIIISADGLLTAHLDKTVNKNVLLPKDYRILGALLARAQTIIKSLRSNSNVSTEKPPIIAVKIVPKNSTSKNSSKNTVTNLVNNITRNFLELCKISSTLAKMKRSHYLSNFCSLINSTSTTKSNIRTESYAKGSSLVKSISIDHHDSNTDMVKQLRNDFLNLKQIQNNANSVSNSVKSDNNDTGQYITLSPTPIIQNTTSSTQGVLRDLSAHKPQAVPTGVPLEGFPHDPITTGEHSNVYSLPYKTNFNPVYVLVNKNKTVNAVNNVFETVVNNITNLQAEPFHAEETLRNSLHESGNCNKTPPDCNVGLSPSYPSIFPQLTITVHQNPEPSQMIHEPLNKSDNNNRSQMVTGSPKTTPNRNVAIPPHNESDTPQLTITVRENHQCNKIINNTLNISGNNNKAPKETVNVPSCTTINLSQLTGNVYRYPQSSLTVGNTVKKSSNNKKVRQQKISFLKNPNDCNIRFSSYNTHHSQFTRNIEQNNRVNLPVLITNVHQNNSSNVKFKHQKFHDNSQSSQIINNYSKDIDWESKIETTSLIATHDNISTKNELSCGDEPIMPKICTVFTLNTFSKSFGKVTRPETELICLSDSD